MTLLSEDCDNAPNSCRLALTHCEDLFHPGERVNFSGSGIVVGNDKWIETAGCQLWRIPRWTSDAASLAAVGWQHWEEVIRQQLRSDDTLFLYRGDNPFYQEITRQLLNRRQTLLTALRTGENITTAVSHLIGLGIGLTPSSDDYLAALQRAGNNTTLLSKITLEEAFNQRYRESIGRLLNQFITEQQLVSTQYITDIKNIGSSSGCDMLYGMADACALSHRSGGNYVDQDSC